MWNANTFENYFFYCVHPFFNVPILIAFIFNIEWINIGGIFIDRIIDDTEEGVAAVRRT